MKVSEGIRLGIVGKKQIKNQWYDNSNGVCAIGALMKLKNASINIYLDFPMLAIPVEDHLPPYYGAYLKPSLLNSIVNRNEAGWTFDEIIKWLESIGQ